METFFPPSHKTSKTCLTLMKVEAQEHGKGVVRKRGGVRMMVVMYLCGGHCQFFQKWFQTQGSIRACLSGSSGTEGILWRLMASVRDYSLWPQERTELCGGRGSEPGLAFSEPHSRQAVLPGGSAPRALSHCQTRLLSF